MCLPRSAAARAREECVRALDAMRATCAASHVARKMRAVDHVGNACDATKPGDLQAAQSLIESIWCWQYTSKNVGDALQLTACRYLRVCIAPKQGIHGTLRVRFGLCCTRSPTRSLSLSWSLSRSQPRSRYFCFFCFDRSKSENTLPTSFPALYATAADSRSGIKTDRSQSCHGYGTRWHSVYA